jgi:hypothetical protein
MYLKFLINTYQDCRILTPQQTELLFITSFYPRLRPQIFFVKIAGYHRDIYREKVWSLAFADDMVIVARSEREMKEMMRNLRKYVRKNKLEVNVEKTKMMVFNKR